MATIDDLKAARHGSNFQDVLVEYLAARDAHIEELRLKTTPPEEMTAEELIRIFGTDDIQKIYQGLALRNEGVDGSTPFVVKQE